MRFHSTAESVLKGEITKLAIIECVVAVALYVGIGLYFHTFRHYAVAVTLAPLMLFRTDKSAHWGLKKYQLVREALEHHLPRLLAFGTNADYIIEAICINWGARCIGFLIRIVATLYWALRQPLVTLQVMPQNWLRQSFCTDLSYPPEVLPLEAVYGKQYGVYTFSDFLNDIRRRIVAGMQLDKTDTSPIFMLLLMLLIALPWLLVDIFRKYDIGIGMAVILLVYLGLFVALILAWASKPTLGRLSIFSLSMIVVGLPSTIFGWIPSVLYRVSFKATCVVYFPFIWVAQRRLQSSLPIKLRLERITKGELEKSGRALSRLVLGVLAVKILVAVGWIDVNDANAWLPEWLTKVKLVGNIFIFDISHGIIVVLGSAALVSLALFYYADAALALLGATYKGAWSEDVVTSIISAASFIRDSLAIVVMAYFFQRAVTTVVSSDFLWTLQ